MPNLKPVLDAARAAEQDVSRILNDMETAFAENTDEGKSRALALRPALDEAKKKADEANSLYVSMRDAASVSNNAAALFVAPADPAVEAGAKTVTRSEFNVLTAAERMKFAKSGGKVED